MTVVCQRCGLPASHVHDRLAGPLPLCLGCVSRKRVGSYPHYPAARRMTEEDLRWFAVRDVHRS
jgi:hypothetical protein